MTSSLSEKRKKAREEMSKEIGVKGKRKRIAEKSKDQGVWFGLGMFGIVGWSVSIPTLVFLAIGIWLDSTTQGQISWTLSFLVLGIIIGCLNAWYWVKQESENR
ncbi:ATP synthase subunit [candidate division KSB1 bacterium]|nr:ATP synthase subunit [candidate division KSB1 bacterium]